MSYRRRAESFYFCTVVTLVDERGTNITIPKYSPKIIMTKL